ncbi:MULTISPECIES: 30S ribosomal protein S4 [Kandleria]|jgi:small subunit ribosomal protein S4|uniref:Small ribosomal subunit protein uS4 n=1 Tax=Kandleria vitulina DSM 20405 TaxID=1410657 RepID=A0A0R2HL38_9FIRM|nr:MULTISPECIES: 30S ribosomal protein S4 [Kandleria]KRN50780.1 30S ribosomal protein S4 [Kandleria vitulina DSM 20405]MBP3276134.1 30S ribosomal protein S4 [Kandleria sp.]MEE0987832.1 30S ribosomal protein S4 [Kandleria vitulina]SDL10532.1 SSU ribosomal protein S4P [Kandleria vitulina]SEI70967.1 SSU ribosomal protein S4P [Kandleria vitulina]
MARYTGPVWKKSRRLGFSILENGKELNKRPYAPGQHGQKRHKSTEYGLQLAEKQKVRHMYGVNEKQFHNTYNRANKMEGVTGVNFLCLLESRLDNVVYRMGYASTRRQARQLVNHGHITLNGKKTDIPSCEVKPGDVVAVREKSLNLDIIKNALEAQITAPGFVEVDKENKTGKFTRLPERSELNQEINEQLIVEYYNRLG